MQNISLLKIYFSNCQQSYDGYKVDTMSMYSPYWQKYGRVYRQQSKVWTSVAISCCNSNLYSILYQYKCIYMSFFRQIYVCDGELWNSFLADICQSQLWNGFPTDIFHSQWQVSADMLIMFWHNTLIHALILSVVLLGCIWELCL